MDTQPNNIKSDSHNLILDWEVRLNKSQVGHYAASEKYKFLHYLMGISLVVISAFVSSSLYLQPSSQTITGVIAVASIIATVLAGVQTFVRPSEKAEIHRNTAVKYGILKRKIELFRRSNPDESKRFEFYKEVESEWNNIAEMAPLTPKSVRSKAALLLGDDLSENKELKENKADL